MTEDTKWAVVSDWYMPSCSIQDKRTDSIRAFMKMIEGEYRYQAWRGYMANGWRCVRVNISECRK